MGSIVGFSFVTNNVKLTCEAGNEGTCIHMIYQANHLITIITYKHSCVAVISNY